jgi:hypothetical protein
MKKENGVKKALGAFLVAVLFVYAAAAAAADAPANVAGSWQISVTGDAGTAEQTIVLTQDGNKITGTFKGPRQSGPLEGTSGWEQYQISCENARSAGLHRHR